MIPETYRFIIEDPDELWSQYKALVIDKLFPPKPIE